MSPVNKAFLFPFLPPLTPSLPLWWFVHDKNHSPRKRDGSSFHFVVLRAWTEGRFRLWVSLIMEATGQMCMLGGVILWHTPNAMSDCCTFSCRWPAVHLRWEWFGNRGNGLCPFFFKPGSTNMSTLFDVWLLSNFVVPVLPNVLTHWTSWVTELLWHCVALSPMGWISGLIF